MSQAYSDPSRESDPHALPDLEVFWHDGRREGTRGEFEDYGEALSKGFYWWACFPGCLPDGDPVGPFKTEAEALEDARKGLND